MKIISPGKPRNKQSPPKFLQKKWTKTKKVIYSELAGAKSHHHLDLAETQGQAGEWEIFIMRKGRHQVCSNWGWLDGEVEAG